MYGAKSWSWWRSTLAYASPSSKCDASMPVTRLHGVIAGGVTSRHDVPSSLVTWMSPSSVPIQIGAERRWGHRVDDAALAVPIGRCGGGCIEVGRDAGIGPREIAANLFPRACA